MIWPINLQTTDAEGCTTAAPRAWSTDPVPHGPLLPAEPRVRVLHDPSSASGANPTILGRGQAAACAICGGELRHADRRPRHRHCPHHSHRHLRISLPLAGLPPVEPHEHVIPGAQRGKETPLTDLGPAQAELSAISAAACCRAPSARRRPYRRPPARASLTSQRAPTRQAA